MTAAIAIFTSLLPPMTFWRHNTKIKLAPISKTFGKLSEKKKKHIIIICLLHRLFIFFFPQKAIGKLGVSKMARARAQGAMGSGKGDDSLRPYSIAGFHMTSQKFKLQKY